jgi:subtilisin family serine protease
MQQRPSFGVVSRSMLLVAALSLVVTSIPHRTALSASASNGLYLVEFTGNRLPEDLAGRIAALGGVLVDAVPEIGVATIGNMTEEAAAALAAQNDVATLLADEPLTLPGKMRISATDAPAPAPIPSSSSDPTLASVYARQWNMRAISADRAWGAGRLGSAEVRVAILDFGIDPTHPDLAGLIDYSRSTSTCTRDAFVLAQEFPGYPSWTDLDGHGTAVASVVASNAGFVAGVTSRTSLMAVKVLGLSPFQCTLSSWFNGMLFAARNGADVINVSIGLNSLLRRGAFRAFAHFFHVYVQYALTRGVSAVVVSAGNDAIDLDHDRDLYAFLCDSPGVICVSATGPTDSGPTGSGPFLDVDAPAFYTNFGASAVNVAAPGGNLGFDQDGNVTGAGVVLTACARTDREIVSGAIVPGYCSGTGRDVVGYLGTSFSAPHVSGLAALLVDALGHGRPAQVKAAILNSADDRGKPGVDPFYGRGRVNVAAALGIQ